MRYSKIFAGLLLILSLMAVKSEAKETPWLNSNIIGAVKSNYKPSEKEDFYIYVNREWLTTAKLKPGYSRTGAFTELQDILDARLKELMTSDSNNNHDSELVKKLYALWLDWDSRNSEGLSELKIITEHILQINTLQELSEYFKTRESFYNNVIIADFSLGFDNKNSEAYNLELSATPLSLGDSAEYKNLTANGQRTKKMHDGIVMYMLRRLGFDENEAAKFLESAYEFENAISQSMMTREEIYSPDAIERMYNPLSMSELEGKSKKFPYAEILKAHNINSKLINLEEPVWLEELNKLYTQENLERIKSYLLCNIAAAHITITDEPAYREYQKLARERYGITESRPDDELAVNFVHGNLPVPVSKLYVSRYVPEAAKREITEIIRDTVKYYRAMLANEEWLSEQTRKLAVEKLENMRMNVAYPDKWVDFGGLEINSESTLINALKAIRKYKVQKYFYDRINTNVDHDLWINDVVVANSYYRPSENSINIIAGILGGDFYNSEMTYEEKLGSIGMVIGHEISHAFDTNGAQFDKSGNMSKWWTDDDYEKFKQRADKLIKYFSAMIVTDSDEHYNGALVQTESIADMAGVKAMLGIAETRRNFDYDKFFRSYARIWKNVSTPEYIDILLKSDVHALAYLRVNAIIQQYEKFFETYGIRKGNKMYLEPEKRVAVW